jgi:hypothetical protein
MVAAGCWMAFVLAWLAVEREARAARVAVT